MKKRNNSNNKKKVIKKKNSKNINNIKKRSNIKKKSNNNLNGNILINKKKFSFSQKVFGLIELGRPIEWSKSLLNMFLAALMVFYVYNIFPEPVLFLTGFFSVAFLWSGLYALNDYTDWKIDLLHNTKKNRPIPSGKVLPFHGLIFSIFLILVSFLISFLLNNFLLSFCLLVMLLNQLVYTMEPFRLKSRKFFDVVSGSMINPFFRYFSGIVLFVSFSNLISNPFPILPVLFVVGIQFSGYSLYRLFSKSHDKKINMKSSVALLPEKVVKIISYFVMFIAVLSYFLLLLNSIFRIPFLGFLPLQYFLAIIIVGLILLLVPSIRKAVIDPQKADMKSSYRILYFMNIAFVFANAIIFIFLR